ncbi:Zinc finger protein 208 [Lucilia cuprina]|nr:Zinc finger protein 208 [Lucilia cuprina]
MALLKRHKTVAHHDGSTVYVCSECGKIAPTETALRSHKKYVHQAERKFKCTICDKGFKVAIVLREHMATHTGEDLYQCPHCPKTFKVNANMHHHRKKAHPKEWAEGRMNKPIITKVDVNLVSNEVRHKQLHLITLKKNLIKNSKEKFIATESSMRVLFFRFFFPTSKRIKSVFVTIMAATALCRLCICAHSEFKDLYDEIGQGNEIYEITVKYFDPMFLNSQQYPQLSRGICIQCWQHIDDFHNFQQSVHNAQMKFEQDINEIATNIKLENGLATEVETSNENISFNEDGTREFCLTQLDIIEVKNEDSFAIEEKMEDDNDLKMDLLEVLPKRTRKTKLMEIKDEKKVNVKRVRQGKVAVSPKRGRTKLSRKAAKICQEKLTNNTKPINTEIPKHDINMEEYTKDSEQMSSENLNNNSNSSITYNDGNESDDPNYHADPDAFVSSNDKQKSVKEKRQEIDEFIANWRPLLECDLCQENFKDLTLLRKHFISEHPKQKCYVTCCQRKLVQRVQIVEHIRYHLDPNTFKCNICGNVFLTSRNLNYHMHDKHTDEGQKRSFECSICQKAFTKKGALKKHMEIHDTDQTYKCSQCEKGFSTEQRRKIHERNVHNADRVCDQCGKTLHGVAALKQHMLEHAGVKKPKWPCDQCNAELTSHSSLKRHKTVHETSKVYACDECGKIAPTQMSLQSHIRYSHKLERKFKCTICDKAFKVPHVLREHMATHTGEDLYQCPHCPQTFKVNANMHHHRKRVHPVEWEEGRRSEEYHNNMCSKERSMVLCLDCWQHINDFHEFHETVIQTRSALKDTRYIQNSPLHIKSEKDQMTNFDAGDSELMEFKEVIIKNEIEGIENPIEEGTELVDDIDDEEHDEIPLSEFLKEQTPLKYNKTNDALDNESIGKANRLQKTKVKPKQSTNLQSEHNEEDNSLSGKIKKSKDSEHFNRLHPGLMKFHKHNEFIAEWKSQLECGICNESFDNFDSLKIHFKKQHNARCYVKCCERTFYRRCALVEHIRLHINPEIYKCDICGKPSSNKYGLKLHKRALHAETQQTFECEICQKIFKQKQNFERHKLIHATGNKDFKCEECGKTYVLEVQLKAHVKLVHNDIRVCDQCGKTLHGIGALKKHLKEHAGIEKPKFPCDECGTILASSTNLKQHKAAYHNDGSTVFVCSICGKVSGSERGLMHHRRYVHEKEKKYKCPHCDKGFKRPKDLQEHVATHTGEPLYQCADCPKTFKKSSKYHNHRKTAHPLEWEKGRKSRVEKQKIDLEQVVKQVIV